MQFTVCDISYSLTGMYVCLNPSVYPVLHTECLTVACNPEQYGKDTKKHYPFFTCIHPCHGGVLS